jgi:protein-S-isoprenylcysteine O-methyltransferase Ste14
VLSSGGSFFVRWRVRTGYLVTPVVLWFAHPVPRSILYGAAIGLLGLLIRAYAAGFLHKQEVLTVTGPYAFTRNPLYLGSSILALGAAVATRSWISAALLVVYFAVFYCAVMRREELELRQRHGASFDAYARAVPLFFPRVAAAAIAGAGTFSLVQYKKNREWKAALGFLMLLAILLVIWRLRLPFSG